MKSWLDIAYQLPLNHKIRIKCCGKNTDAVINHTVYGFSYHCFKCGHTEHKRVQHTLQQFCDIKKLNALPIPCVLPKDFTDKIPRQYACWLYKAGLDADAIMEAGIGWSDSIQRIVIPVYGSGGELLYFQCRAVHEGQLPKYKNPPINKSSLLYMAGWVHTRRIIVCEDILSAIRVGKHTPACSILGTSTSDEQAGMLSDFALVSYWLDPDPAGIKGAKEGSRKLSLATETEILSSDVDPKYLPDRIIRQILKLPAQEDYTYHGCLVTEDTEV